MFESEKQEIRQRTESDMFANWTADIEKCRTEAPRILGLDGQTSEDTIPSEQLNTHSEAVEVRRVHASLSRESALPPEQAKLLSIPPSLLPRLG